MSAFSDLANAIFRDYSTDGDPSSGVWKPQKSAIRALLGILMPPGSAIRAVSGNTTVNATDETIEVNAAGGAVTITFPLALPSSGVGRAVQILKTDTSDNLVNVIDDGSATVRFSLAQPANGAYMQRCMVYSNGAALRITD